MGPWIRTSNFVPLAVNGLIKGENEKPSGQILGLRAQYGLHKMCVGTRYAALLCLHLVSSASHVVHSSAFGPQNIDTPFFMLPVGSVQISQNACRDTSR
jgi:hypothetical protein